MIPLLVTIILSVPVLIYFFIKRRLSYWQRRGVPYITPEFIEGNTKEANRKIVHPSLVYQKFYDYFKKNGYRFGGIYDKLVPIFIPVDNQLIKSILVTDFTHFVNHDNYINEEADPLTGHLFGLRDEKWRNARAKLTPTFTTGKIKMMFQTMVETTSGLEALLNKHVESKDAVDIKDVLCSFTIDIITSVAFGIDSNSINNPDSEFKKIAKELFSPSKERVAREKSEFRRLLRTFTETVPEEVWIKLRYRLIPKKLEVFFTKVVSDIIEYREKNNVYRKDFMHLLIQLRNMGKVTDDSTIKASSTDKFHLSINEIAAHSFIFFIAGFETSSTAMTFALFHIAQNQDIQDKLREEINTVLEKHNGKLSYDAIMEMEYLEQVLLEALRMHGPMANIVRVCNKEYKIPNSDVVLEKGTKVTFALYGIHYDEDFYKNPYVFDPDRFSAENKRNIPSTAFLPFGEGPRLCIGLRFGKLQAKVGLYTILKRFKVAINKQTQLPIRYDGTLFFPTIQGGLWLDLEPLN